MQQRRWLRRCILGVLLCLAAAVQAQQTTTSGVSGQALLNLDNTVALHGYDPVAYFTENEAVKGRKSIFERLGGATYWFASRANKYTFLKDAPKFPPQFGGFCATSMALGRVEDINPEEFAVYNDKLYVFRDGEARALFLNNPARIGAEATEHYFRLASRKRESY